ncbi:mycofactocin biosynthesis glycosyltransferase MftF [Streptomyces sp. NPDC093591]|uniref:mycofactocin biosynthesis glycosyltransferase MftF n=1 Tax=Streptomyces sp. NPDC093591 TaxID=3366044 RepID=UPI0037FEED4E
MTTARRVLPDGFTVRVRRDVLRRERGRTLVGGSPLRLVRLSDCAIAALDGDLLRVRDAVSGTLARRLLDANIADPVFDSTVPPAADLTVVIPVRDRPEQLDRALGALSPLTCVVVDDASEDPGAVARVAARHGARLVTLADNAGPAGARNAGLRAVATPLVAFVDSDVEVTARTLRRLARHLTDPSVAMVGPLVRSKSRTTRPRWFERYDEQASSLALGHRPCSVRPGAAVGWLPSACLVGRVEHLGDCFDPALRVGEDVDLVWRLVDRGLVVRYDPAEIAFHDARPTVRAWLGRKFVYGTGGADLAARHGTTVAPAVVPPVAALSAAALLVRRRWSWPLAAACLVTTHARLRRTLSDTTGQGHLAARLTARGTGWAVRQEAALLVRHSWPLAAAAACVSSSARRAVVSALVVDTAVQLSELRRPVHPSWVVARQLDNLAYGGGLWWGALRRRDAKCLVPRFPHKK